MAKIHTGLVWDLPPVTFRVKQLPDGSYCFDERHGGRRLRARSQRLEKLQREAEAFVRSLRPANGAESELAYDYPVAISHGKKPLRLDFGKVIIPVAQYADGRFVIDHTVAGKRIRITRLHLDEIKIEAKVLAERIAGKPAAGLGMAPWEREDYVAARGVLVGMNVPLHTVAEEWREDRILLGSIPLIDFIRQHQRAAGRPVPEIFAEFLAAKERQGRGAEKLSGRYLRALRYDVGEFTPAEMRTLLASVSPAWQPWVLIGGFAGVRTEELSNRKGDPHRRLFWEDIDWTLRHIVVRAEVAKNGVKRLVTMPENLQA